MRPEQQPSDEDKLTYVGNMWGWKFSYISLGIILFFVGLAVARHWMLGEPFDPARIDPPIPVEKPAQPAEALSEDSLPLPKD
ncbi:MAG TPA: hypothetical protein PKC76_07925 [Saprospiraceae bacterium]|nr:hypothetical protein [Saprospiraceae bacterium]HMP24042.1 hypothetical protein [Saprospiraceae bacterium]